MLPTGPSFHVHPETGNPGRCRAHLHACPYGAEDSHFDTQEEARDFYEDYASKLTDPNRSVEFHFVTDDEESDFLEGDCAHLARAIHKKTGWPMVIISTDKSDDLKTIEWDHMAVRAPDGRIIDAFGMQTEKDFKEAWGAGKARIIDFDAKRWGDLQDYGQVFDSSPTKVANKILKSLGSLGLYKGS